ncbi:RHS repeat-associated core domain-containing protein, partial [Streptomyces sp. SM12]
PTPLRFPGQYADPETTWHYNLHRHYNPHTARYTTPDPLGLTPNPNPHTYPHNPHTGTDPHGLAAHDLAGALRGWQTNYYQIGNEHLRLTKERMSHIMERHHPTYRNSPDKTMQSNFRRSMTVDDIETAIRDVVQQNKGLIADRGIDDMYQVIGTHRGERYTLGINRGAIGQFFPGG